MPQAPPITATGLGLFGQVEGTVKNVRLEKSLIDVVSNRKVQCGGIAGEVLRGQILNCSTDFRATVNVASGNTNYLGGIVGNIASLSSSSAGIKGCASTAALTGEARTAIGRHCRCDCQPVQDQRAEDHRLLL